MSKLILMFLGLFFTTLGYGQTNIKDLERTDGLWRKKGEKNAYSGAFVEYFDDGKIKGKGEFKEGLVHGLRIIYFENGNKALERNYLNGINHGASIEYHPNGQIKQEISFKNGKEDGIAKVFYENGQVQVILTFSEGVQQGDYFEYTPNGKLTVQYYFVDGEARYSPEFMELVNKALELSRQFKNEEAIKLYNKALDLFMFNNQQVKKSTLIIKYLLSIFEKKIFLWVYLFLKSKQTKNFVPAQV